MAPPRAILAACCFALLGAIVVHACTSGSYLDPNNIVSFRSLDLPSSYFNDIAFVPAGLQMTLLPVAGKQYSSLRSSTRVKYSFVCLTSSENILKTIMEAADRGLRIDTSKWPGGCGDGMNMAGLHVSSLMQPNSTGINRYSGTGPAVEQMDLVNYLLARYDSVEAVRRDLTNGQLNPVLNPNFEIVTKLLFQTDFATLHYNIRDNYGASLVIEYSGPNNLQWWDNAPYNGALANNPLWQDQIAYFDWYWRTQDDPYRTFHDSKFLNLPGAYNSSMRFLRAATLPKWGYAWEWPKDVEVSPRYAVNGQPDTNPALITLQSILSSVYLPKGIDDAGGRQCEESWCITHRDIVWFVLMADHKNLDFYYRVANTPQWRRISLKAVSWGSMDCIKYMKLRGGRWWVDDTDAWARNRREELDWHQAPDMTIAALIKDIQRLKA